MFLSSNIGEELTSLLIPVEDLQADPESDTQTKLIHQFKESGIFQYKYKNYRLAIILCTEAIKIKSTINDDIKATLFNNRSAAHYYLKDFKSSLSDCISALAIKPDYLKAKKRAINCAFFMKDFGRCIKFCDDYLLNNKDHHVFRTKTTAMKMEERAKKEAITNQKQENTLKLLNQRKIKFYDSKYYCGDLKRIPHPIYSPLAHNPIFINGDNIYWPILFIFPEYNTTDYLRGISELTSLNDCLKQIFQERPNWDTYNTYKPKNLNCYFENKFVGQTFFIDKFLSIKDITKHKKLIIHDGTLTFYVVVKSMPKENVSVITNL